MKRSTTLALSVATLVACLAVLFYLGADYDKRREACEANGGVLVRAVWYVACVASVGPKT